MKKIYSILLCLGALSLSALFMSVQAGNTTTVSDLTGLRNALATKTYDVIIVSQQIVLTDGTTLDGKKADGTNTIVQVPEPYIDESGLPNTAPSNFGALRIDTDAKVTLSYLTIMGGGIYPMDDTSQGTNNPYNPEYYIAAVQNGYRTNTALTNGGTLKMDHCTIQRSERGLYNTYGQTIMTHCKLIRNTARFGAGALNEQGKLIMDGCSFSENRSTRDGGALESKNSALTYLNNTIMANNIGGLAAINNNTKASCYFMNCTVTGNVSYNGDKYSVYNSSPSGVAYAACNSIITNNKYFTLNGGTTLSEKDIQNTAAATIKLYNCINGTNTGTITLTNCTTSVNSSEIFQDDVNSSLFYVDYRNASNGLINYKGGLYYFNAVAHTPSFNHAGLVQNSNGTITAPVKTEDEGGKAATGGCKTYFHYVIADDYNDTEVYMGYQDGTTIKDLTDETKDVTNNTNYKNHQVTTYANGETRQDGVIGSSPATSERYYTLALQNVVYGTCTVNGASLYSDAYKEKTMMTVTVTPIAGESATFTGWTLEGDGVSLEGDGVSLEDGYELTDQTIKFKLTNHTKLTPNFEIDEDGISYTITYTYNEATTKPTNTKTYTSQTETFTLNNPEKTGHTFLGWIGSNGTTPQTTVSVPKYSTGNKFFSACWAPQTFLPKMNPNYPEDDGCLYGTFYDAYTPYVLPAGVEAYTATFNDSKTLLTMHKAADPGECIPADYPVILKAHKSSATVTTIENAKYITLTYDPDATPNERVDNDLSGTQEEISHEDLPGDMANDTYYILSNRTANGSITGIGFYRWNGYMPAHKAYTIVWGRPSATTTEPEDPAEAVARRHLPFDFSATEQEEEENGTNVATDIDQISNEQLQMSNKLLIDGHLYIIRDARVYNAQGQIVK